MFSINKILNRISDPKGPSKPPSPAVQNESAEGFLCPSCMRAFPSAEALEDHYETSHVEAVSPSSEGASLVCPACKMRMGSEAGLRSHFARHHARGKETSWDGDPASVKQELAEMHASLEEERRYSEELKKEVSRLQDVLANKNDSSVELAETEMLRSQARALEESKTLLTSEVVLLRQRLGRAEEAGSALRLDKEQLERKAALLDQECAALKARADEVQSRESSAEEKLQEATREKGRLEAQLALRPAEEDVLREELLRAHGALEELKEEWEVERDALRTERDALKERCDALQGERDRLEEALQNDPKEEELQSLHMELWQLSDCEETLREQLERRDEEVERLEAQLKHLQRQMEVMEAEKIKMETVLVDRRVSQEKNLRAKDTEAAALRRDLSQAKSDLKERDLQLSEARERLDKWAQLDRETREANAALKEECWVKSSRAEELQRECEAKDARAAEAEAEAARLREALSRLEAERCDLYSKIEAGEGADTAIRQLKRENALLQERVAAQEKHGDRLAADGREKMEVLHRQLHECSKELQATVDANEKLRAELESTEDSLRATRERLRRTESDLRDKGDALDVSEADAARLRSELDGCRARLEEKSKGLDHLVQKLESASRGHESERDARAQLEAALTAERHECAKLQGKCASLEEALGHKSETLATVAAEKSTLLLKLEESAKRSAEAGSEARKKEKQLEEQLEALREKMEQLQEEVHTTEETKNRLEESLRRVEEEAKAKEKILSEEAESAQKENARLAADFEDFRRRSEAAMRSLEDRNETLEAARAALRESLGKVQKEHEETFQKVRRLSEELVEAGAALDRERERSTSLAEAESALGAVVAGLESRVAHLEVSLSESRAETDAVREDAGRAVERHRRLTEDHEEAKSRLASSELQLKECRVRAASAEGRVRELEAELEASRGNERDLAAALEDLNRVKQQLSDKVPYYDRRVTALENRVASLSAEKEALETALREEELRASRSEARAADLDSQLTESRRRYEAEGGATRRELASLEEARQLLIQQKVDVENLLEATIADKEAARAEYESATERLRSGSLALEEDVRRLKTRLEEQRAEQKELASEWERERARLEARVGALSDDLDAFRDDLGEERRAREAAEARLDALSGDKLELEAKLENTLDERRALLDRCLEREAECDRLRALTSELRKKQEDSVAALQELGWENQALQVENAKYQGRKWADDAQVTHCMDCQKLFTMTVRKHHCRNCGNIFCNECSSRTATIPSSKRPARVCKVCYTELAK